MKLLTLEMFYSQHNRQIEMKNEISSLSVSLDSSQLLFNYAPNELQLWDLNNHCLIKKIGTQLYK